MKYCSSQGRSHETVVGHAEAWSKYQNCLQQGGAILLSAPDYLFDVHSAFPSRNHSRIYFSDFSLTCYKCEGGGHADAEDDEVWPLEQDPHPLSPGQPGIAHTLPIKHHGSLLAETWKTRPDLIVVIPTQIHFRLSGPG